MVTDGDSAVSNPEIGTMLDHGPFRTNYHDIGDGSPVLLLHGSGPGVTAWANWRLMLPALSTRHRVIAPDLAGFGYTHVDDGALPAVEVWMDQLTSLLDELSIDRVSLVGNSFGGAMALWLAATHPERVDSIVLMGSVGAPFELTEGLDAVWGYEPSLESMEHLLTVFVYDPSALPAGLARARFEASTKGGAQERWAALFPAPRQRWIDSLALSDAQLRSLENRVLIVHGRDDQVIPLDTSLHLLHAIDDATLHVWPHTGHWVQIERASEFGQLVLKFLDGGPHARA
jgi:2-hydroxymuconate-semialdehyde hydrolase